MYPWLLLNRFLFIALAALLRLVGVETNPATGKAVDYVPADLDDAIRVLKQNLTPDQREAIKASPILCHRSIGMGIRNSWGLWRDSSLARWFLEKGVQHPDSMSGIILDAFAAHAAGLPFDLDQAVQQAIDGAKRIREMYEKMEVQGKEISQKIQRAMMNIQVEGEPEQIVRMPDRSKWSGIRVRYMAPFANGILLMGKAFHDGHYILKTYFLNLTKGLISHVKVPGIDLIEGCQVFGESAYISGLSQSGSQVLIRTDSLSLHSMQLPPGTGTLRLGRDGNRLLAVRPHGVYRLEGDIWEFLAEFKAAVPDALHPPLRWGNRIYIRDEGIHESDKRLWWIDIEKPDEITNFDKDSGLISPNGPRWESIFSFVTDSSGALWLAPHYSLVRWDSEVGYRVWLINGAPTFEGELLKLTKTNDELGYIFITGIDVLPDGKELLLYGPTGLYRLTGTKIAPVLGFQNMAQYVETRRQTGIPNWTYEPAYLLPLKEDGYLFGATFDGVYSLTKGPDGKYAFAALDEVFGPDLGLDQLASNVPGL